MTNRFYLGARQQGPLQTSGDPAAATRRYRLTFGAEIEPDGVRFRLWAPHSSSISLQIEGESSPRPMRSVANGLYELTIDAAGPGTLYRYMLPGGESVPDPASRFQPQDVGGPSEVIDASAYRWSDVAWLGRPWHEAVLYELHVGTFTSRGTFRAGIERLDTLVDLGVTAVELMPVADFPGERNWGYDGVYLFAPDANYGRPEDMKAFVDAAHARGLMVILDVVYNHFGPEGNCLPIYAPIFTDHHHTPWGNGMNFDDEGSETVRKLIVANAGYWIEEYHLDGLRLDAVHMMKDDSPQHILDEIAGEVRAAATGREVHLILEDERNTVARIAQTSDGRTLPYTAQWNDDLHHAMHVAITGERAGYYARFAGNTEKLGRALAWGSCHPNGVQEDLTDNPCAGLPPTALVSFLQNHDQVGNRAFGDRLVTIAPREALRAATAIYLLSPQIPILFMGEEWGTQRPFPFFCDFGEELSEAIRKGRKDAFADFPAWQTPEAKERLPDPTMEATFLSAKLDWENADLGEHAEWRALYRGLLACRRATIVPRLENLSRCCSSYDVLGEGAVSVRWRLNDSSELHLIANLSKHPVECPPSVEGERLWLQGSLDGNQCGPWTAAFGLRRGFDDDS